MNENLNLAEILKDCPKGTKLYSTIFGEVKLHKVRYGIDIYTICIENKAGVECWLTSDGRYMNRFDGECTLFPSREERNWSNFKPKKPKFDPNTLQAFDKVLVRSNYSECWRAQLFSYIIEGEVCYPYLCINNPYKYCIPYNDNTKHLVGTTKEAPEFYRYWED